MRILRPRGESSSRSVHRPDDGGARGPSAPIAAVCDLVGSWWVTTRIGRPPTQNEGRRGRTASREVDVLLGHPFNDMFGALDVAVMAPALTPSSLRT